MRLSRLAMATLMPALLAVPSVADPAEDTVAARQGYFKLVNSDMAVLSAMAKGEIEYDAAAAQQAADNLVALSNYSLAPLVVPGTSSSDLPDVAKMKMSALEDPEGLMEAAGAFGEAAAAMQLVAGNGQGEMAGALGDLGGACKGCHQDYREKD